MNILVLNCGSSSLKFQIIGIAASGESLKAKGIIERIGSEALISLHSCTKGDVKLARPMRDHRAAIDFVLSWCISPDASLPNITSLTDIVGVGHRVVHGGERFSKSILINDDVIRGIEDCIELAPLHNPANIKGIKGISAALGSAIPQVAVFDTAFHLTMPETAYLYALPYQFYARHKVRRYGFHGTSHRFVSQRYSEITSSSVEKNNIIVFHLGNGCSACAISGGVSVDTSMGMTPTEGLVMGTRCGDIDPSIVDVIAHREGMTAHEITSILNKQSGLLGISGLTNDMRELISEIEQKSDRRARLAVEIFSQRIKKYIGSYMAVLGGADAIVFTGGIGENSYIPRALACAGLERMGIEISPELNSTIIGTEGIISKSSSKVKVYVIPTNEELMIVRDTYACIMAAQLAVD